MADGSCPATNQRLWEDRNGAVPGSITSQESPRQLIRRCNISRGDVNSGSPRKDDVSSGKGSGCRAVVRISPHPGLTRIYRKETYGTGTSRERRTKVESEAIPSNPRQSARPLGSVPSRWLKPAERKRRRQGSTLCGMRVTGTGYGGPGKRTGHPRTD